jgi:1-acyl-sn-glycerol-3-phosphate acyltransferase
MHRLLPVAVPTGSWTPKLLPWFVRATRPLRRFLQRFQYRIDSIEVRGIEHLRRIVDEGQGAIIGPNHVAYSDPFLLQHAADELGRPFYFMSAWQVFGTAPRLKRWVLQRYGCFSVYREGNDLGAFRQAVDVVANMPHPLVIFPEGEMYHLNDRVLPFHEGPAAIARTAAKRASRNVHLVPCALKYVYQGDPSHELLELLNRLELHLRWQPRPDLSMSERIYRLAEGALALKELEYVGRTSAGPLPERIHSLADAILVNLEKRHQVERGGLTLPERIKALRRRLLGKRECGELTEADLDRDLDALFTAVQLISYPGDYVREQPSMERLADTLDKFEEDILGVPYASIRGIRRGVVVFGEPICIEAGDHAKAATRDATDLLEQRVQSLLDSLAVASFTSQKEKCHADTP